MSWLRDLGPGAKTSRLGTSPPLAAYSTQVGRGAGLSHSKPLMCPELPLKSPSWPVSTPGGG